MAVSVLQATHVVPTVTNPAVKHSLGHAAAVFAAHNVHTFDEDKECPAKHELATDATEHELYPTGHYVHLAPAAKYIPG